MPERDAEIRFPRPWLSGSPIHDLQKGWAKAPGPGTTGHVFRYLPARVSEISARGQRREYISLCGFKVTADARWPLLGIGCWPHCSRCAKKFGRSPNAHERRTFLQKAATNG